jgi:hypothetical protein
MLLVTILYGRISQTDGPKKKKQVRLPSQGQDLSFVHKWTCVLHGSIVLFFSV